MGTAGVERQLMCLIVTISCSRTTNCACAVTIGSEAREMLHWHVATMRMNLTIAFLTKRDKSAECSAVLLVMLNINCLYYMNVN
jgi:hypothetical protein